MKGLNVKTISKDWGYELLITKDSSVVYMYKNRTTDWMQQNRVFYLQTGNIVVRIKNAEEKNLKPGMMIAVDKSEEYQITSLDNSEIFSVSGEENE